MSKKRAFVRYSKQGKIVPGSLILTAGSYPNGPSTWQEVPADLCCETTIEYTSFRSIDFMPSSLPDTIQPGLGFSVYCQTGEESPVLLLRYDISYPPGINTTEEIVEYLNTFFEGIAIFNVLDSMAINFSILQTIKNAICPEGVLEVSPLYPA